MMGTEFLCEACGAWVFNATLEVPPDPPVCLACGWCRTLDPEDREAVEQLRKDAA
jgi:hypothetical protein